VLQKKHRERILFSAELIGTQASGDPGTAMDNSTRKKESDYAMLKNAGLEEYSHIFVSGDDTLTILEEEYL
jgi:hypothetical protein